MKDKKEAAALDGMGDILLFIEATEAFIQKAKKVEIIASAQKAAITRAKNKKLKELAQRNKKEDHTLIIIEGDNHYYQIFDDAYKSEADDNLNPINEHAGDKYNFYEAIYKIEDYKKLNYKKIELWMYSSAPENYTFIREYDNKTFYCMRYTIELKENKISLDA